MLELISSKKEGRGKPIDIRFACNRGAFLEYFWCAIFGGLVEGEVLQEYLLEGSDTIVTHSGHLKSIQLKNIFKE